MVSKVDGWDVIEQKIRVAGVAMLDDDLLRFRSICPKSTETSDQSVSYIRGISDGEYWMHNSEAQFEMFMKYCGSRPCIESVTPKSHIEIESYANEMHVIFRPCIDTHSGGVFPAHL